MPPRSTPFPYTTLFRSEIGGCGPGTAFAASDARSCASERYAYIRNTSLTRVAVSDVAVAFHATVAPASQNLTRSEEHTSELQSLRQLVCRLLLEKKKNS